ncbi:MAG: sulfurtransferase [Bacteroidetes bacterium]|nr:sulfurtransferase [Bacteroidota bacterium]
MSWSNFIKYSWIAVLFVVNGCSLDNEDNGVMLERDHLINVDDLLEIYNDQNTIVIDFRSEEDYLKGHVPGALNIYRNDVTVKKGAIKGLISPQDALEKLLGSLGIQASNQIVVYDGRGACESARFWWTLNFYGFKNGKVVNGDFDLWSAKGYPMDTIVVKRKPVNFIFPKGADNKYIATKEDVKRAINDSAIVLVDTRSIEEYEGELLKKGAFRRGHIPTSIHVDWVSVLEYEKGKEFKSVTDLLYDFERKGITKDKEIIFYCQSGTRSALCTFVLVEILGYKNVKNYDGSWIEWSYDLSLEID